MRQRGFPERVALLIENHVQAKRYLTNRFPEYYEQLSQASKKTLEYQGGPMTDDEAKQFENHPLFPLFIQMRKWDELAKEINQPVVSFIELRQRARKILMAAHP